MADENEIKRIPKKMLAGAGGGVIAFTTVVFAYIDSKVSDVDKRIEDKYALTKEYVDARHSAVEQKLNSIENILIRIDNRVYELNHKQGK